MVTWLGTLYKRGRGVLGMFPSESARLLYSSVQRFWNYYFLSLSLHWTLHDVQQVTTIKFYPSGKLLNLNDTQTTWTEKMAWT
jgi:hypothetical protein